MILLEVPQLDEFLNKVLIVQLEVLIHEESMLTHQLRKNRLQILKSILSDVIIILILDGCVDQLLDQLPCAAVE